MRSPRPRDGSRPSRMRSPLPGSARRDAHRERLEAEEPVVAGPGVRPGRLEAGEAADQLLGEHADLEPGEVRAEAVVDSLAEGEVRVRVAADVEAEGLAEHALVAIRRHLPGRELV